MNQRELMVLIDGHAMLYRAFFAFPQSLTTRDGMIVNAVYGFSRMLLTTIGQLNPTHMMVSFDVGKTFRHEQYPEYKAHREKMPEELKSQETLAFDVVKALNMPLYLKDGYEADDVLGTLSMKASGQMGETDHPVDVMIVTGDMDALQLVRNERDQAGFVHVYNPGGGQRTSKEYDEAGVVTKLGVRPEQVSDMKGLSGDSSDNIPGIYGVGPKTAERLLQAFGDLEGIYSAVDTILRQSGIKLDAGSNQADSLDLKRMPSESTGLLKGALLGKLIDGRKIAFQSRELATIVTDVALPFVLDDAQVRAYDKAKAESLFLSLQFESLMKLLPEDTFEHEVQEAFF